MPIQLAKVVPMKNGEAQFLEIDEIGYLDEGRFGANKKPVACECKPPSRA
jgi:hypothetical protein